MSRVYHYAKKYLTVLIGCLVYAVAVNLFFVSGDINTGGLTGISIILHGLFHTPVGMVALLLNIPLFILGWRFIGWRFMGSTLIATVVVSVLIDLTAGVPAMISLNLSNDRLLASICGGAAAGAGLGFVFSQGVTTGGTDIAGRLLMGVFRHLTMGRLMLAVDVVIVFSGAVFSGSLENALYSFVALFISSSAIDGILYGLDRSRAAIIITKKGDEVTKVLLNRLERGVTRLPATGGYSGHDSEALICAVGRRQTSELKELVLEHDPGAFVILTETTEIMGDGFKPPFGKS